jgi:hypothetical protein
VVKEMYLGDKIAFLPILEEKDAKPVSGAIWGILKEYGASE